MDRADLRATLARHVAADRVERGHVERVLALLDDASAPFARDHFEPGHVTASAFVLSPTGDEVLLILHGKLGLWLQPGDHVDPEDPDIEAAARREVLEETGAHLEPERGHVFDVDVHRIPANPRRGEPPHEHHDVRVLLRATDRELAAGSDALAARWVPLEQVAGSDTDDSVRRAVLKLLAQR